MIKKKFSFVQLIIIIMMSLLMLSMVLPLISMFARSISDPEFSKDMTGLDFIPRGLSLINYKIILGNDLFFTSLKNSIYVTIVGTIINILLTTTAAYVLTRPNLVFKQGLMLFLIVMMLFEPGLLPEYLLMVDIKLMNTHWSIILSSAVNVYYLIIMMRYFDDIPIEMFEAATIDGAGHMQIMKNIVFPLAKAGIATIFMFYAVVRWNEYYKAGIYITDSSKTLMPAVLRRFIVDNDTAKLIGAQAILEYGKTAQTDYTALKNATVFVSLVPVLMLYPLILRFYTEDIMGGGIKG